MRLKINSPIKEFSLMKGIVHFEIDGNVRLRMELGKGEQCLIELTKSEVLKIVAIALEFPEFRAKAMLWDKDLKMKKVSAEWIKEYDVKILDPDGWDRENYDYSFNKEKITRMEFEHRLISSTIQGFKIHKGKISL
jgi:hypothetical protein